MYQPWNEQELASASPGDLNNSLIPIAYNYWIRIDATLTNNLYWHYFEEWSQNSTKRDNPPLPQ